ncbi:MAG: PadR family transcriptional regulator [Parvibaculum sp.]|nr:PadR family transcriptional regulator [Parvibaculum sp.]
MNTKELLLSVLMTGPATGYDIKKILEQEVSEIVDVTVSNIYPALNELAEEGLVRYERVEQEGRPNKKVYELTEEGRAVCLEVMMTCDARQRLRSDFMYMLSYAPYLPRARVAELLNQRMADSKVVHRSLNELEVDGSPITGRLSPGQNFCIGLGRVLVEAERNYILQHRENLLRQLPEDIDLSRITKAEPKAKVKGKVNIKLV